MGWEPDNRGLIAFFANWQSGNYSKTPKQFRGKTDITLKAINFFIILLGTFDLITIDLFSKNLRLKWLCLPTRLTGNLMVANYFNCLWCLTWKHNLKYFIQRLTLSNRYNQKDFYATANMQTKIRDLRLLPWYVKMSYTTGCSIYSLI